MSQLSYTSFPDLGESDDELPLTATQLLREDAKDAGAGNIIRLRQPAPSDSVETELYSYPERIDLTQESDVDIISDSEDEVVTVEPTGSPSSRFALRQCSKKGEYPSASRTPKQLLVARGKPSLLGEDSEEDLDNKHVEEKEFRINAKSFANTYPQSGDLTKERVHEWYKQKGAIEIIVSAEKHEDGSPHIHVYAKFAYKLNVKSARHFDIDGHHGKYMGCKNKTKWLRYIKKDGDFLEIDLGFDAEDYEQSTVKKNYEGYLFKKHFKRLKALKEIQWPLQITDENKTIHWMNKGEFRNKKRHWWIIGQPDAGKTTYINRITKGMNVWWPAVDYQYEGYDGQELVIYDDVLPKFSEIADVANEHLGMKPVYGKTRYTRIYWHENVYINIIVLSNKHFEHCTEYNDCITGMHARFNVIHVSKLYDEE